MSLSLRSYLSWIAPLFLISLTAYFLIGKYASYQNKIISKLPKKLVTRIEISAFESTNINSTQIQMITNQIVTNQSITTTESSQLNSVKKKRGLIFTIAVGNAWYKPFVKANRELYCKRHGYHNLFLENLTVELEQGLHINWSKITEGLQLLNESAPYDWIFFADLDLFIMNLNQTIENVIEEAIYNRLKRENNHRHIASDTGSVMDTALDSVREKTHMVLAKDLNGYNFGSIMVRNSKYARYMFEEIWNNRYNQRVPNLKMWCENAVFVFLCQTMHEYASHVTTATQSAMNAYSGSLGKWYMYKPGEFVVHFPGPFKTDIPKYVKILAEIQPEIKPIYDAYELSKANCNQTNCDTTIPKNQITLPKNDTGIF
jgi:hypothetical protein